MLKQFYKNKKVLVTGGLGFLGSNLANHLAKLGASVTVLDCLLGQHGGNLFNIQSAGKKIRFVRGDIRDLNLVEKLVVAQDILFNIAAQTSHTASIQDPFLDADINVRGQINILESCKKINPKISIVYCSSRAVYGASPENPISESSLPNPLDIYAANKLVGEQYHKIYQRVYGIKTIILRVANGYGPCAQMKGPSFGILNWFTRLAMDDQEIKIFGDGKQVRDYVYVDDIVLAFLSAGMSTKLNGEVLNVASGRGIPLINIVKKIVQAAGKGRIIYVPWPEQNKKIDVGDFVADIRNAKKFLNWKPQISLEDGIGSMVAFYKKNKKFYW